jgi:hypothetical protein
VPSFVSFSSPWKPELTHNSRRRPTHRSIRNPTAVDFSEQFLKLHKAALLCCVCVSKGLLHARTHERQQIKIDCHGSSRPHSRIIKKIEKFSRVNEFTAMQEKSEYFF